MFMMMMSVSKPRKLIMPQLHSGNGSQDNLDKNSPNSTDSGSPHRSWQNTLDQLSVGLQKICKSPVREGGVTPPLLNGSQSLCRSASPLISDEIKNLSPGSPKIVLETGNGLLRGLRKTEDTALKRVSENMGSYTCSRPMLLIQDLSEDHIIIRVRHEESTKLLQKQLALISGYQSEEEMNVPSRSANKEMAAKVTKRRASSVSRFRKCIEMKGCSHEELFVEYKDNQLCVMKISKEEALILHTVTVPKNLSLQRLVCTFHEDSLVIAEYPKKVIYVESSCATFFENYYCPVVAEDVKNDTWKLVWHVPKEFQPKHVIVKTVDDKLELLCRQHHDMSGPSVVSEIPDTKPETMKKLLVRIDLPDNVDPKTVSAILSVGTNQLIIQGISGWRSRCVTY